MQGINEGISRLNIGAQPEASNLPRTPLTTTPAQAGSSDQGITAPSVNTDAHTQAILNNEGSPLQNEMIKRENDAHYAEALATIPRTPLTASPAQAGSSSQAEDVTTSPTSQSSWSGIDTNLLTRYIEEGKPYLEKAKGKDCVLIIGETGIGKSTISIALSYPECKNEDGKPNAIIETEIERERSHLTRRVLDVNPALKERIVADNGGLDVFNIGHSKNTSCTAAPGVFFKEGINQERSGQNIESLPETTTIPRTQLTASPAQAGSSSQAAEVTTPPTSQSSDGANYALCDCPGFGETGRASDSTNTSELKKEKLTRSLANLILINRIIQDASSIRIVFAIHYSKINAAAGRGAVAKELRNTTFKLIKSESRSTAQTSLLPLVLGCEETQRKPISTESLKADLQESLGHTVGDEELNRFNEILVKRVLGVDPMDSIKGISTIEDINQTIEQLTPLNPNNFKSLLDSSTKQSLHDMFSRYKASAHCEIEKYKRACALNLEQEKLELADDSDFERFFKKMLAELSTIEKMLAELSTTIKNNENYNKIYKIYMACKKEVQHNLNKKNELKAQKDQDARETQATIQAANEQAARDVLDAKIQACQDKFDSLKSTSEYSSSQDSGVYSEKEQYFCDCDNPYYGYWATNKTYTRKGYYHKKKYHTKMLTEEQKRDAKNYQQTHACLADVEIPDFCERRLISKTDGECTIS